MTCMLTAFFVGAASGAQVSDRVKTDGMIVRQTITFEHRVAKYRLKGRSRHKISHYVATFRFERRTRTGWKTVGMPNRTRIRQRPQHGVDFRAGLYPDPNQVRQIRRGHLRLHGSTDLHASLVLRLN
jgi:hypothetical protein